jgi:transcriptional regulator with XRE-family HTH domain
MARSDKPNLDALCIDKRDAFCIMAAMTRTEHLRLRKGWSQSEMGTHLGLSQSQVSRLETGFSEESGAVLRLLDLLEAELAESSPRPVGETTGTDR